MGEALAVRTDFSAGEVRRIAKRAQDAAQARRLLAIAAVLDALRGKMPPRSVGWTVRPCGTG